MTRENSAQALRDRFADRQTTVKILLGFVIAGILVYLLGAVAGWGEIRSALRNAAIGWLLVACLSTLLYLAAWGKAWQVVLAVVGIEVRFHRLVVT
ncbi:MAG: TIGR00374 family protein, partial [Halobacteriales archaeon]|nr:TIGR00374 family protein [Halobacteriales archaeon]